ncbi:MAG: diguanylate cyclase [Chloroflexota bacterium]
MTDYLFVSPLVGVLGLLVLFALQSLAIVGRWRRGQWRGRGQALLVSGRPIKERELRAARHSVRSSDFLSRLLSGIYYATTAVAALLLIALPFVGLGTSERLGLWLLLNGLIMAGALVMTYYWQSWDDDVERLMRRRLLLAEEHILERRGLRVRDPETNLHALEFWLRAVEARPRRLFLKPRPTSCLVIEVVGFAALIEQHGADAGSELLRLLGQTLARNVRSYDVVARLRGARLVVGLHRCPGEFAPSVARRVTGNLERLALQEASRRYGLALSLRWGAATMPGDASTPRELVTLAEKALERSAAGEMLPTESGVLPAAPSAG